MAAVDWIRTLGPLGLARLYSLIIVLVLVSLDVCRPDPEKEVATFVQATSNLAGKDMLSGFEVVREKLGYTLVDSELGLTAEKVRGDAKGTLFGDSDTCNKKEYVLSLFPMTPKHFSDILTSVTGVLGEPNGIMEASQEEARRVWLEKGGVIQVRDQVVTYWTGEPLDRAESISLFTMPDIASIERHFTEGGWLSRAEDDIAGSVVHVYTSTSISGGRPDSPLKVSIRIKDQRVELIRIQLPFVEDGADLRRYPITNLLQDLGFERSTVALAGSIMSKAEQAISGTPQVKFSGNFVLNLNCRSQPFLGKLCHVDLWRRPKFVNESCSQRFEGG